MTGQSPVLVRCERCRAVISSAEAKSIIRHGVPCGVCGGTLALCGDRRRAADLRTDEETNGAIAPALLLSAERTLLGVLRRAEGRPVAKQALSAAGIDDPAGTIFELEQAGHQIEEGRRGEAIAPHQAGSDAAQRQGGQCIRRGGQCQHRLLDRLVVEAIVQCWCL